MGINVGAVVGPIVAGRIAEGIDWHLGFACAGVGMTLGLVQYVVGRKHLQPAIARLAGPARPAALPPSPKQAIGPRLLGLVIRLWQWLRSFTREEWKRIAAVFVFFVFASLFWGAYEQAGSTLTLFADRDGERGLRASKLDGSRCVALRRAWARHLS